MNTKTKKQHYVWECYLQAWSIDRQIWCMRKNKIFKTSTENVAQERYFYEAKIPTPAEIEIIVGLLSVGDEITCSTNLQTFLMYLLTAVLGDESRRFGIELYHAGIEQNCLPIIQKLVAGNDEPLKNSTDKINLAIFIGHQYTRTKKIRESFVWDGDINFSQKYKDCDFQKIYEILTFIYASSIGGFIYRGLNIELVKNTSEVKFITCDQPVYNLLAIPGATASDVEFYYPVSPTFALMAKKSKIQNEISCGEYVGKLNSFVFKNAHEFIFAASAAELEKIHD